MKKKARWILGYAVILASVLGFVFWGNRTVTTLAETAPIDRCCTILIDAGHGGVDGGATSCTGVLESQFNLEIALKLDDLLHLLGYQTRMVRTTDISVYTKGESIAQKKASDLKERVRMAEEIPDGLLLSIHQNTFSDSRYSGAQVFYADTQGSQALAKQLQSAFTKTVNPGSKREIKKGRGIYLMEHIRCTGVLIECGFLSNPEEEAKLRSKEYQQQLCCVIGATLAEYLSNT